MGSEQSLQASRREREERERARWNNNRATTATDVQVALEQQRKLYEQKLKDLLEEQQKQSKRKIDLLALQVNKRESSSAATTTGQQPQPSSNAMPSMKPLATAPSPRQPPPPSNPCKEANSSQDGSLERQRAPYSYNRNELQGAVRESNPGPLYPNLGTCSSGEVSTALPRQPNSNPRSYFSGSPESFVFINSHFKNNDREPSPRSDFRPSAPPSETSFASSSTKFRSRSRSRQREQNEDIKCPTCCKMFGERIYQCNNGHSSCHLCKMRQVSCGQCRLQLTDRRNFDLEKYVIERLQKKVKCPNSSEGCCLYVKIAELDYHGKECSFNLQKCPSLGSCNWKGKLSQLSSHFHAMHPWHLQGEVDTEIFMSNISDTSHTMHYVRIGSFNFLFHVKVSATEGRIYMAAQLIGTKQSASKWDYDIHIYKKNEPRRKFQYIDRCSSSTETIQEITESTKCAVIPVEFAETFICGGVLAYKFYIKKHNEVKTNEHVSSSMENRPQRYVKKYYSKKN